MNTKHLIYFSAIICCGLLEFSFYQGIQPAHAQNEDSPVSLVGPTTETGVSGFKGSVFVTGGANSTSHALYGISSQERSDKPCLVTTLKENINDSSKDTSPAKDLCGNKGATSSEIKVNFSDSSAHGKRTFVTGVQVCMNNKKTRVKGLRIRGNKISDSGILTSLVSDDCSVVFDPKKGPQPQEGDLEYRLCNLITEPSDIRTNCDEKNGWMKWAECPSNSLATAAALHFESGNKPRSLTGIALKCRHIKHGIAK